MNAKQIEALKISNACKIAEIFIQDGETLKKAKGHIMHALGADHAVAKQMAAIGRKEAFVLAAQAVIRDQRPIIQGDEKPTVQPVQSFCLTTLYSVQCLAAQFRSIVEQGGIHMLGDSVFIAKTRQEHKMHGADVTVIDCLFENIRALDDVDSIRQYCRDLYARMEKERAEIVDSKTELSQLQVEILAALERGEDPVKTVPAKKGLVDKTATEMSGQRYVSLVYTDGKFTYELQPRGREMLAKHKRNAPGSFEQIKAEREATKHMWQLRIGKRHCVMYPSIKDAVAAYNELRDDSCEGASTFPEGTLSKWGEKNLYISYNGRVWDSCSADWKTRNEVEI